jgi:UDP-N-acetylglucosamine 2-epimerase
MRKICVITGSRAEYGLLRWVMQGLADDPNLDLQIIATGMHLSPVFGLTFKAIESDGFIINRKVEMLSSSDTPVGIAKSMGMGMIGFAEALDELNPDLIVVLGDRFEIFSAVAAALVAKIPVAHIHGGEKTEGAFSKIGVSKNEIPEVLMMAIDKGKIVGFQGANYGRPIFRTSINGRPYDIAITTSENGFIVGATFKGSVK